MNLQSVDHLIYGTPDIDSAVDYLETLFGVRAVPGGQHLGHGTRNALLTIGPSIYLEILGPDPEQPEPDHPRWLGIDDLIEPRLVAWAARRDHLERVVAEAAAKGVTIGRVQDGRRHRPDGVELHWTLTDPEAVQFGGLVPFFIDWGSGPHPSDSAPGGPVLTSLEAEHPEPATVQTTLSLLGLDLPVHPGELAGLVATLEGAQGAVELR